jgi:hypothetical protein
LKLLANHDLVHGVGVCGDAVGVLVDGVYVVLVGVVVVVVQVVVHIRHQAAVRDQSSRKQKNFKFNIVFRFYILIYYKILQSTYCSLNVNHLLQFITNVFFFLKLLFDPE